MAYTNKVNQSGFLKGVNANVTLSALLMVLSFVLFSVLYKDKANGFYSALRSWITEYMGWYYIGLVGLIFVFSMWLAFSKFGQIRLGKDDEKPEFSNFTWFAMLFSAAVGTGLMFWSIAEPMNYIQGTPFSELEHAAPLSAQAAQVGIRITIFHWGLSAWSVYVLTGLILGYFAHRKGLPLTIRSALYPILGDRIYGPLGHIVDLLAIFSTLFGTATTLGLGASQMNAGLSYLFGLDASITSKTLVMVVVMAIAALSAVSGLDKGIKLLSEWNIKISIILFLFFLIAGPTLYLFQSFFTNMGDYLSHFTFMSFWVDSQPHRSWQGAWTIFYWAWWLSWGPYVGMFIARISKGKTVKQLLLGAILSSTLGAFTWITIMGGTANFIELYGAKGLIAALDKDVAMVLYSTIEAISHIGWVTWSMALLATLMIISWFVTSADSATLVICTIVAMGSNNPPVRIRIIWSVTLALIAIILLHSSGGADSLKGLQSASIAAALPFSFVLILMMYCLLKSLYTDTSYQAIPSPVLNKSATATYLQAT